MTVSSLKESIRIQREKLTGMLSEAMHDLGIQCAEIIDSREKLESLLHLTLPTLLYCKHLYVLDADGVQLTNNIMNNGEDASHFGRDRMNRPYMEGIIGTTDFKLSEAYISRNKKRPSFTAVQVLRNSDGERIGFLGADFDLRELPDIEQRYVEPDNWRQVKGDPAIRNVVFHQQRADSQMDLHLDEVLPIMNELITEHGVFHGKLHFSSSRATIWLLDDPYNYRILNFDEIIDPDICLAYPRHPYDERAIVPAEQVINIFEIFRSLRFADDNVYLRAGSVNIINGMVGLNFSCDGSHYMRYDEFLEKNIDFWFGSLGSA
ncbi:MAG: PDC sensor domain-containing protein [Gammaproteobacteria bacterium]|nr:PDC sensor domain-containing protein [Gammaproteobacteria bacterium]MCW9055666.1 PDC sensor domain-containing protein [Gammaproteobacteria bacterium]